MNIEESPLITAVILTRNEAHRLPSIFENLKDFARIEVFDAGSTDGTKELCIANGVKFQLRKVTTLEVCGAMYKDAFAHVRTPYMLLVSCAHFYPQKLKEAFKAAASEGKYHAVYHDVITYNYGKIVHRPFFRRRSSACNFFRVDAINFEKAVYHNEVAVDVPETLKLYLPPKDDLSFHMFREYDAERDEGQNIYYANLEAKQRFQFGARTSFGRIVFKTVKAFLRQYIRCGSICYGTEGLIYALKFANLELSIQIKIWEQQNQITLDSIRDENLKQRKKLQESGL
jgi:glycosyltransferase involved in cell wall biosynthesis